MSPLRYLTTGGAEGSHFHNEVLQWIVIAVIAFAGGYIITADHQRAVTDKDIQAERAAATRRNCEDANRRHDQAITVTLDLLDNPAVPRKLTSKQARAYRRDVLRWVDTIVPARNCDDLVKETVRVTNPEKGGPK